VHQVGFHYTAILSIIKMGQNSPNLTQKLSIVVKQDETRQMEI